MLYLFLIIADTSITMDIDGDSSKRKLDSENKRKKEWTNVKKPKLNKFQPIYKPDVSPSQALNEIHPNLTYTFEEEKLVNRIRFICNVIIELGDQEKRIFKFSGDGLSKKEAKKNCCLVAMITLYGETYKPPKQEPVLEEMALPSSPDKSDLQKRMAKIISPETIKFKSPSQMLNELDLKLSETGQELGVNDSKFTYRYTNIHLDEADPKRFAYGSGKSLSIN